MTKKFEIFRQKAIKKEEQKMHPPEEVDMVSAFRIIGLVGWLMVIPVFVCLAIGRWCDTHFGTGHLVTLTLLGLGICAGFVLALLSISREMFQKK